MSREKASFNINPNRIRYILDLYNFSTEDFLSTLNEGRKRSKVTEEDFNLILNQEKKVDLPLLRRIDDIFDMGLSWYISDRELPEKKSSSIFFRKQTFNSELNFESKKRVTKFEELKFEIQNLCDFIGFSPEGKKFSYDISKNPKKVASDIITEFDKVEESLMEEKIIGKTSDPKEYLKNLIRILEEFNIFVFEYVDRKRKEERKATFDGFFISPNIIVIKRQQNYFRREIFTLIHEIGHYLIDKEEIDIIAGNGNVDISNKIERWCYDFAYYFLSSQYNKILENVENASKKNNYLKSLVERVYNNTFLSYSSIYTHLLLKNKISYDDYRKIIGSINRSVAKSIQKRKDLRKMKDEKKRRKGKQIYYGQPKPIISNLFKEIVEINFVQGNINRNDINYYGKIFSSNVLSEVI